ncbi:DUF6636 domain-containing protein [Mangrovihabitans endophyticus]|uniref:DUF6636 domain-containing protein n=1 Tax=Mangrovihabitans endophyticus TaxID=1751298 RepID=UPI00166488B0|nr:DUF6636 domain-containing protein [Mangrovihabitans endophyticus]
MTTARSEARLRTVTAVSASAVVLAVLAAATSAVAGCTTSTGDTPARPAAPSPPSRADAQHFFVTPSRNIGCLLVAGYLRCDVGERAWTAPPPAEPCAWDYGFGVEMVGDAATRFSCVSDSTLGAQTVLPYGKTVAAGSFVCTSGRAALRCRNVSTGHGFTLSRERYELF